MTKLRPEINQYLGALTMVELLRPLEYNYRCNLPLKYGRATERVIVVHTLRSPTQRINTSHGDYTAASICKLDHMHSCSRAPPSGA